MPWDALSFIKSCIKPLIGVVRKAWISFLQRLHPPDCTCEDLDNYITRDLYSDDSEFDDFLIRVEGWIDFGGLNEFLRKELFQGKIIAWGKETRNGVVSLKETLIPRSYWEFNKIIFLGEEVRVHSEKEVIYTEIRFNQKQVIEQLKLFFNREIS